MVIEYAGKELFDYIVKNGKACPISSPSPRLPMGLTPLVE